MLVLIAKCDIHEDMWNVTKGKVYRATFDGYYYKFDDDEYTRHTIFYTSSRLNCFDRKYC